jgi:ribosomal protein S18 acetylase RimI-like enzyme
LQRRAFRADLAYGMPTLSLLWALPGTSFLVARRGGAIVGCAIGDRSGDLSRVISIAVDPDVRRQGIGEQLLHALEIALPTGDMILMVQEENRAAQALYEKAGFQHVGASRNYYGKGQNGLWMRKVRTRPGAPGRIFV